jgi:hypothetical protein
MESQEQSEYPTKRTEDLAKPSWFEKIIEKLLEIKD